MYEVSTNQQYPNSRRFPISQYQRSMGKKYIPSYWLLGLQRYPFVTINDPSLGINHVSQQNYIERGWLSTACSTEFMSIMNQNSFDRGWIMMVHHNIAAQVFVLSWSIWIRPHCFTRLGIVHSANTFTQSICSLFLAYCSFNYIGAIDQLSRRRSENVSAL